MDPLSHLIIGVGLATLSGRPLSINDPVYLACSIGAMIPDLDIIWQLRGDLAYLKHHRGSSHSFLGNAMNALLIAGILKLIFPVSNVWQLIMWAFAGALSHSLFDICNSYGAQLLYPWKMKRITLNLVQIFDPIVIAIFGLMAWSGRAGGSVYWSLLCALPIYLGLRWKMRHHLYKRIKKNHWETQIVGLVLLPSLLGILRWDYLLETVDSRTVGKIALHSRKIRIFKHLEKGPSNTATIKALQSRIGEIFQSFTPYFHITHCFEGTQHVVRFFDLRYQTGQEFKHSATVVLDQREELVDEIFHAYNKNRNARVM